MYSEEKHETKENTMRFKEHDNQLFRMLEEPVPLTPDAEMPCLVRLIQDDSPMGLCNRWKYSEKQDFLKKDWTISSLENNLNKVKDIHYSQFEIIGYPVDEGSAEWALYQMMHGKWVYNPSLEKHKSDKLDTRYLHAYGKFGQDIVVKNTLTGIDSILGAANISHWTNYAEPSGWQLYKEPKPKPLLADTQVGDLCKHRNGDWSQIIDTNGTYIQGQPIRTTLKDTKGINRNFCLSGSHFITQFGGEYDIIHTEPLAPEGSAEWAWQMAKLGIETKCIYGKIRIHDSGMTEVCYNGMAYAMPLTQSAENRKYVINKIRECSPDGWQLYEPKPEQQKSAYQVGDFVVCTYYRSPLPPKNSYERVIEVSSSGIVTKANDGCVTEYDINGNHGDINGWHIERLVKPEEYIIHIGCLSGTVEDLSYADNGRFFLVGKATERHPVGMYSILYDEMLDAPTRELVESLLKAQEEKQSD